MSLFNGGNSIEAGTPQKRRATQDEDTPIRAMTGAEVAGTMLRRDRADATPVKAVASPGPAPAAPGEDSVAKMHGFYTAEKRLARVYYADYQQKSEVMRATDTRITTKLDDRQTVAAMIDLSRERGWDTLKLRGSETFKREAWVQAQALGLQTEGYKPTATDKQEADRRVSAIEAVNTKTTRQDAAAAPSALEPPRAVRSVEIKASEGAAQVSTRAGPMAFAAEGTAKVDTLKAANTDKAVKVEGAPAAKEAWNTIEATGRKERAEATAKPDAASPRARAAATA